MAGQTLVPLSLPPGYVGREGQLAWPIHSSTLTLYSPALMVVILHLF